MPAETALIVFPLAAALLFAIAAIVLKHSSQCGAGAWQTTLVVNLIAAVSYSMLWGLGGPPIQVELLWQPALIAVCLFGGMTTQFIALEKGDVSIAVPVLGLKVIFVALLTPLLSGESVGFGLWIAAILSVAGVAILNRSDASGAAGQGVTPALAAGGCAAVCFALFDLLVQEWGPIWGTGRLLTCIFWMNGLLSLLFAKACHVSLRSVPRQAWRGLIFGGLLISLQSGLFVGCLSIYGKATAANIIYSSRGLLSVLLAWAWASWFTSSRELASASVTGWRVTGAVVLLAAVAIASLLK